MADFGTSKKVNLNIRQPTGTEVAAVRTKVEQWTLKLRRNRGQVIATASRTTTLVEAEGTTPCKLHRQRKYIISSPLPEEEEEKEEEDKSWRSRGAQRQTQTKKNHITIQMRSFKEAFFKRKKKHNTSEACCGTAVGRK